MSDFTQTAPKPRNRFRHDATLRYALERHLPPDIFADAAPRLDRLGERAVAELPALADAAERTPPRHVPYDAWGRRVDRIEVDPAFDALVRIGERPEDGPPDIARQHLAGREHHGAQQQQRQPAQRAADRHHAQLAAHQDSAASCRKICDRPLTATPVTVGPVAQM